MSEDAIRDVLNRYTEGTRTRDVAMLRSVFHAEAVMSGWLGPDYLMGGPQPFFDAIESNEVGPEYVSELGEIDIDGPIATGTVSERNLFGLNFTNHFHLTRQPNDSWLITAKLFRHA
ncbi:MAG: nuclear transport factor 2 family protein [Pseudomonadota bacterium]